MRGCTFPSTSLTPGSACFPSSPEVSTGLNTQLLQAAPCAGCRVTPVCGRELLSRPWGAQEESPTPS